MVAVGSVFCRCRRRAVVRKKGFVVILGSVIVVVFGLFRYGFRGSFFISFRGAIFPEQAKWKENNLKFESAIISNLDQNEPNWNRKLFLK